MLPTHITTISKSLLKLAVSCGAGNIEQVRHGLAKSAEKHIDPQMYSVNRGDGTSTSSEKVLESELPISSTSVDTTKMIQVLSSFLGNICFFFKNSFLDNFTLV